MAHLRLERRLFSRKPRGAYRLDRHGRPLGQLRALFRYACSWLWVLPPLAFVAPIYGGETRGRPVPTDAPPLFTVIAHDDRLLFRMVEGLYVDWTEADRSAELHIFARGAHGFGMIRQNLPSDRWIDLLGAWLADRGFS